MLKKDLRKKYTALRKEITAASLINSSLRITNSILTLPLWSLDYYHLFMPISQKKEIDTSFLLSILRGKQKNIIVPKVNSNGGLLHCLLLSDTKFQISNWQIPEPEECHDIPPNLIDVVFIPLLAFDTQGNRVGYGKGFYDKFLKECRTDVIKVGLCLFEAEDGIADISPDDVPLNYCVTPKKIYKFPSS